MASSAMIYMVVKKEILLGNGTWVGCKVCKQTTDCAVANGVKMLPFLRVWSNSEGMENKTVFLKKWWSVYT